MPLPDTLVELAEAGYRHFANGRCRICEAKLFWFLTPKNRKMPFSMKSEIKIGQDSVYRESSRTRYEPHFAVCVRKKRRT